MPALNNSLTKRHYVIFAIWLGLVFVAAAYFISGRLITFDPSAKLISKDSSFVLEQIKSLETLKGADLSNTIIHFTSDDCSCTKFSEEHKASIDETAKLDNFKVINVSLPSYLSTIIPSTPSVLIVSGTESLLYFGPYSVGLACTQYNGYVETVMQNYSKGFNSNLIVSDVKGCYCNI